MCTIQMKAPNNCSNVKVVETSLLSLLFWVIAAAFLVLLLNGFAHTSYLSEFSALFLYSGVLRRPRQGGAQQAGAVWSPFYRGFNHPVRLQQGLHSVWKQPANML